MQGLPVRWRPPKPPVQRKHQQTPGPSCPRAAPARSFLPGLEVGRERRAQSRRGEPGTQWWLLVLTGTRGQADIGLARGSQGPRSRWSEAPCFVQGKMGTSGRRALAMPGPGGAS